MIARHSNNHVEVLVRHRMLPGQEQSPAARALSSDAGTSRDTFPSLSDESEGDKLCEGGIGATSAALG